MLKSSHYRGSAASSKTTNSRFSPRLPLFGGAFFARHQGSASERRLLARLQGNQGRKQGRKASKVASSTPTPVQHLTPRYEC